MGGSAKNKQAAGIKIDAEGNIVRYDNGAVAIRRRKGRQVGRKGRQTGNTATAFERARSERYADTIQRERKLASDFMNTVKNARPISEKPEGMKTQEWLAQNPDLDKGLRLLKRNTTTLRKLTGKKSEQSVLHMPTPVKYDRNTQRLSFKASDREEVMKTIRAIEKEMNLDLGFAISRIDWI